MASQVDVTLALNIAHKTAVRTGDIVAHKDIINFTLTNIGGATPANLVMEFKGNNQLLQSFNAFTLSGSDAIGTVDIDTTEMTNFFKGITAPRVKKVKLSVRDAVESTLLLNTDFEIQRDPYNDTFGDNPTAAEGVGNVKTSGATTADRLAFWDSVSRSLDPDGKPIEEDTTLSGTEGTYPDSATVKTVTDALATSITSGLALKMSTPGAINPSDMIYFNASGAVTVVPGPKAVNDVISIDDNGVPVWGPFVAHTSQAEYLQAWNPVTEKFLYLEQKTDGSAWRVSFDSGQTWADLVTSSGAVAWGDIIGTLSNQTDLATALADAATITTGTLDGDRLPALSVTKKGGVPATGTVTAATKVLTYNDTWVEDLALETDASNVVQGTLDGDRLPVISTTKLGGVPATGTPSGKFLRDDSTWAAPEDGWFTVATGKYTATPASTSQLTMSDTSDMKVGYAIEYTIGGTKYYGVVDTITTDTLINIQGAPMGADVTALRVGPDKAVLVSLNCQPNFNAAAETDVLRDLARNPFIWRLSKSYLVRFQVTQGTVDSTTQSKINISHQADKVSTENTNDGPQLTTAWAQAENSSVAINTSNYDINWGEAIEVVTDQGGTGDAAELSITATYVKE